ncbi:MAG: hypothetical protein LC785_08295 [Acidobacteria bacterium]|nr:hypothetical protein [Acidobacteriota bacterium]MCA1641933.1 hypothetical protein [Acidobacteriota bacterium]
MTKPQNNLTSERPTPAVEPRENVQPSPRQKKEFVEPVVSVPIDVLEATSFFLLQTTVDAVATN